MTLASAATAAGDTSTRSDRGQNKPLTTLGAPSPSARGSLAFDGPDPSAALFGRQVHDTHTQQINLTA